MWHANSLVWTSGRTQKLILSHYASCDSGRPGWHLGALPCLSSGGERSGQPSWPRPASIKVQVRSSRPCMPGGEPARRRCLAPQPQRRRPPPRTTAVYAAGPSRRSIAPTADEELAAIAAVWRSKRRRRRRRRRWRGSGPPSGGGRQQWGSSINSQMMQNQQAGAEPCFFSAGCQGQVGAAASGQDR